VYQISSKSDDKQRSYEFQKAFKSAAANLKNGGQLPVLYISDSECSSQVVYQLFTNSDDKQLNTRNLYFLNMASVAILENAGTLSVLCFSNSA
jgi:hypothetical protein